MKSPNHQWTQRNLEGKGSLKSCLAVTRRCLTQGYKQVPGPLLSVSFKKKKKKQQQPSFQGICLEKCQFVPGALFCLGGYQPKFPIPPWRLSWSRSMCGWDLNPGQAEAGSSHAALQFGGCVRQTSTHFENFQVTQGCNWNIQVPPGLEES